MTRWEQLFTDLDARFEELAGAEMMSELADRQRVAAGTVSLVQRCSGAIGATIRVRTRGGPAVEGVLRQAGPDWMLLEQRPGRELLVALAEVAVIDGLLAATGARLSGVTARLDLRYALRGIARDRSPVALTLAGGGAAEIAGTIDRVGADFIELAVHAPWEPRRAAGVRSVALISLSAIGTVRPLPWG